MKKKNPLSVVSSTVTSATVKTDPITSEIKTNDKSSDSIPQGIDAKADKQERSTNTVIETSSTAELPSSASSSSSNMDPARNIVVQSKSTVVATGNSENVQVKPNALSLLGNYSDSDSDNSD